MHGCQTGVSEYFAVDIRFIFPCIQDIRMSASQQSLLIYHTSPGGVDD